MEPFLYLTVDCERVAQLVREKVFDTVICLGDAKFVTGNEWMITTGYFERMIYIGMNKPVSNARNYYSFAVSEMHNWFDSPINQPIIEVQNDEAIDKSINAYKNIIKDLQENRGSLKYPIDSVYNYTFPLSEEIVEKLVDRFDEYLSSNLNSDSDTWRDPILIVYENIMKCLKNGGNKKKLEYLNKLLTDKKKNRFFFITSD